MKENKKQSSFKRTSNYRNTTISVIRWLTVSIFSFQIINIFENCKVYNEKLLIRFANIRV